MRSIVTVALLASLAFPTLAAEVTWTSGNDGSGSGLDADRLDGLNSNQFLRSDISTTLNGMMTVTGNIHFGSDTTGGGYIGYNAFSESGYSLYTSGAKPLSFGTNSTRNMTLLSTGNVGIGVTNPGKRFEVLGDIVSRSSTGVGAAGSSIVDSNGMNFWTNPSYNSATPTAGWTRAMTLNGTQVGIGTPTPGATLDVNGNIHANGTICNSVGCIVTGSGTAGRLVQWSGSTTVSSTGLYSTSNKLGINTGGVPTIDLAIGDHDTGLEQIGDGDLAMYTNNVQRLRINNTGRVSIKSDPDTRYSLRVDNQSSSDDTAAIAAHSWADTGNTFGLFGVTNSDGVGSGSPAGVFGWAVNNGPGGDTFGVLGRTSTQGGNDPDPSMDATAAAVYGEAIATSGMSMGVWGETFSSTDGASGVRGVANTSSGVVYGVHGSAPATGYAIFASGRLSTTSGKPAVVYTDMQGPTELYSMESPDMWFEDIRFAQLQDGRAHIEIDPLFRETITINADNPFHVFLQTYDAEPNEQLTVHKTGDSFDVISVNNPTSDTMFSYRIMAKRHHYENDHLRAVGVPVDIHMRPDLSQEEIDALNEKWHLTAIPQKEHPLDL